ncbi:MAG: adenylate/guanylate cyclase domain-containing protein [Verrucomicrobiales bacterium]|nr:adenylate/guanylate cyclase domain-containing protein [Verrucomicrobiales bacterium]
MYLIAVNLENPREMSVAKASEDRAIRLGRRPMTEEGEEVDVLRITWNDRLVSRNHCEAVREGDRLSLSRLPALAGRSTPNALYSMKPPLEREVIAEPVSLSLGDAAVIGAKGTTALLWLRELGELEPALEAYHQAEKGEEKPFEDATFSNQNYDEVAQLDEYSLRLQLKLLQKELPEQVLTGWTNDTDLFTRASIFLENALPGQKGVSAVFLGLEATKEGIGYEIESPDPTARADFRPSRTLLSQIDPRNPEPRKIHIWSSREHHTVFRAESLGDQVDWVIVIPVARLDEKADISRDSEGRPLFLYVETRQASETAAASFVPFLRLISSLVASLLSAREEQKLQDQMAAYFSPGLRRLMQRQDQSVLEPAMVDCTVMFADRRGHSRMLEVAKSDEEILDRLDENQKVVGLITEEVFRSNGVVTDFAGDGALGLWGWPNLGKDEDTHALEAVEAAEAIIHRLADRVIYEEEQARDMAAVRIGISTGRIAVGKTGPAQQWHISVFGSVANLGARLERIAKEFRIPVLVSDDTFHRVSRVKSDRRFRKLCLIRPAGFEESYPIYELVLPKSVGGSGITEEDTKVYEEALQCVIDRRWDEAIDFLDQLPHDDPPSAWLREKAVHFRENPPGESWGGEISSISK